MSPQIMAHSKSNDQSLKEEKLLKEKLLDEKMRLIRQKNEERLKRQKEIEEDIKNANTHSEEVTKSVTTATRGNMSGVNLKDKPAVSKFRGRARGKILEKMSKEQPQAQRFRDRQRENYKLVEKELKEEKCSPGHGFLSDDRRVDMSKMGSRSVHSWGGSQFEDVVDKVKSREPRHGYKREQDPVINMTGKERLKYQEWKDERIKVDQARQSRQKRGDTWHREWDKAKVKNNFDSKGGRQDHHQDRTHASQRFGERQRHKPAWDLHDNRGDNDNQEGSSARVGHNHNQTHLVSSSQDWDVNKSISNEKEESVTVSKGEDWEEETQDTPADIPAQDNLSEVSYQPTCTTEDGKDSTNINLTDEGNQHESTNNISGSELQCIDKRVENDTMNVDSQGKIDGELVHVSVHNTEDIEGHSDDTGGNNLQCISSNENIQEDVIEKTDQDIDPSTQLNISSNLNSDGKVGSEDTTKTVPKTDNNVTTEQNHIERNSDTVLSNEDLEKGSDVVGSTPLKDSKPKEILPKLDLSKTDEEPVPDFLKTPQHKDWADYDFDEEELDFSQDLIYYQ